MMRGTMGKAMNDTMLIAPFSTQDLTDQCGRQSRNNWFALRTTRSLQTLFPSSQPRASSGSRKPIRGASTTTSVPVFRSVVSITSLIGNRQSRPFLEMAVVAVASAVASAACVQLLESLICC